MAQAANGEKTVIFDCPGDIIRAQLGRAADNYLTPEMMTGEIMSRFDGDTMKIVVILVEWLDQPNIREGTYPKESFDTLFFFKRHTPGWFRRRLFR